MSRDLDIRTFTRNCATPQRAVELQTLAIAISDRLPGKHRITIERIDPTTGNAAHITSTGATASTDGNFIKRALDHVRAIGPAIGVTAATEFVADSAIQVSNGARAVQLQQRYRGLAVFQAVLTVRFGADGALQDTSGTTVAVRREASTMPRISVKDAVRVAAAYIAQPAVRAEGSNAVGVIEDPLAGAATRPVGLREADEASSPWDTDARRAAGQRAPVDLTDFEPSVRVAFTSVEDRLTLLEAGPFGSEIKASLVWLAVDGPGTPGTGSAAEGPRGSSDGRLVLGWHVLLALPRHAGMYTVIVDAISGEPAYCRWAHHQAVTVGRARGRASGAPPSDSLFTSAASDSQV